MIKRTPIVDKDDRQLYLDDGLRRYVYWIVVSNSATSRIAQGRGNQENLIKDFYGLGLAHIPTGSLAANAYFMIAALAWNLKMDVEAPRGWRGDASAFGITGSGKPGW